ncbi:DNA polymerase III subunit gamma/tau [Desulfonema ishimotonii]|uniref:DNA polymerase III subunit gamma/tau n=1 Tax=Desulfonema ishimotonii TaxID=45657 RepID=A0A401FQS6_9BACT|nr:DNA polymerase III subunit gamma/tau [Desulfonema ishimotonii]GBC59319.1 DNA polymerase III subunit gamma/tau [Desulfonema ishimotonii]
MSYLVLARKYRPQTFEDVVKQEHVTRTLANAIVSERVAHAILFSGPRGTGKTTIARILAKAMNCEQGPTPTPCNRCRSCQEITNGNAVDVFEVDGASNNGVDHIRELRENIRYMPAHSRYKIYIIDEVHMLSTAAFNALLKTLEEPPAHVMFLFATTEPHKIPITILSRCQRHDLRRIDLDAVSRHMAFLCQQEGTRIAPETLGLIARESGGSMRDALSLLDQVMSCAQGDISHEQVLDILGVVDQKVLFDMSAAVLAGDVAGILEVIDEVYDHGHNLKELYAALVAHFRNLLVVAMGKNAERLVDVPAHEYALMAEQVRGTSEIYLTRILDILFREESAIRFATDPRLALEMAFIRAFQVKPALSVDTLIQKLDALAGGTYVPPAGGRNHSGGAAANQVRESRPAPESRSGGGAPLRNLGNPAARNAPSPPQAVQATAPRPAADVSDPVAESPPLSAFNPDDPPERSWEKFVERISDRSAPLASCLGKCYLKALTPERLCIQVGGNGFDLKRINKSRELIQQVCDAFFGRSAELEIIAGDRGAQTDDKKKKINQVHQKRQAALNHPLVEAALEIFDGTLVDVKIL